MQDYWGFTLTSSRTIEAISWAEAEVMEEEVSFPITYLGDSSNRIATVHNSGPGILNVSGVYLINGHPALSLNNAAGLTQILPNQTYELSLSFTPVNEGVVSDSLIIESDARENSRIAINVSGQGNYAPPMPPANVNITVDYPDAVVTWDAVTQSVLNSPVSVPYYFIYGSKAPNATEDEQFYLGYSTSTSFTHLGIGLPGTNLQSPRQYFYYVCAVLYYPSRDSVIDLDSLVGKVSRKELKKLLRL